MKSFLQMVEDTEEKLQRPLQINEIEFLQWVYARYKEDSRKIEA